MTTTHQDPYASEADTDALLVADTRTPAERQLAALFDAHGGNEQGAEPELVLRRVALALIERQAGPTHREVMRQALDALEGMHQWTEKRPDKHPWDAWQHAGAAIINLREALEAPQEDAPFTPDWANYRQGFQDGRDAEREALAAQEPAAGVPAEKLTPVIQWLEAGCDPKHAATELRLLAAAPQPPQYEQSNPLGGPAKVFDAMAAAIRAGDDYHAVLRQFGFVEAQPAQEPLFWFRPRSDGMYEGPIHNAQIERVRKESGGWVPLYTAPPAHQKLTEEQKDAARYRWLRATTSHVTSNGQKIDVRNQPSVWDEVIDAAIEKATGVQP